MKKSIKCGIAAAVVMAAGFAAYQTHGAYGAQDNSLLMQNVEALTSGTEPGEPSGDGGGIFDDNIAWFKMLHSGKCGFYSELYEIGWEANGFSYSARVGISPKGGYVTEAGITLTAPSLKYKKKVRDSARIETGTWRVCKRDLLDPINVTCDRCKQKLCDGTTDCKNDLAVPDDNLDS